MKTKLLKNITLRTILLVTLNSVAVAAPLKRVTNAPEPIDFNMVNPVIKTIAEEITKSDDQVEWAYPSFDVLKSSFINEKLFYSLKGTLKNTIWNPNDKASFEGISSYEVNRVSVLPGIEVKAKVKGNLDLLAIARFAGKKALEQNYVDTKFRSRMEAIYTSLSKVQSIDSLFTIFKSAQDISIELIEQNISEDYIEIDCINAFKCGSITVDQWGNKQKDYSLLRYLEGDIASQKSVRASLSMNQFSKMGDEIIISNPFAFGFFSETASNEAYNGNSVELKKAYVKLSSKGFESNAELFIGFKLEKLNKLKTDLQNTLKGASIGGKEEVADIQEKFKRALVSFKKFINQSKK